MVDILSAGAQGVKNRLFERSMHVMFGNAFFGDHAASGVSRFASDYKAGLVPEQHPKRLGIPYPDTSPKGRPSRFFLGPICAFLALCAIAVPAMAQSQAQINAARDACRADYEKFCKGTQFGGGRIIACLKQHGPDLSAPCSAALAKMKASK